MQLRTSLSKFLGARPAGSLASVVAGLLSAPAWSDGLEGVRSIHLVTATGSSIEIGSVAFEKQATGKTAFMVNLNRAAFTDHFLSMKEFKCVGGVPELMCHVPYPYPAGTAITDTDFAWLEHSLLFMFKRPADFGAKLWNGVYFQLVRTPNGFIGKPQAVDLNLISAPPADTQLAPFKKPLRDDYAPNSRWISQIRIE